MIKAIMAVDEEGGISRGQSMPWPKNSIDLKWFKQNTINNIAAIDRPHITISLYIERDLSAHHASIGPPIPIPKYTHDKPIKLLSDF